MGKDGRDYSNVYEGGAVSVTNTMHHLQHEDGGVDEVNVEGLSGVLADEQKSNWSLVSGKPTEFPPEAHATSHQDGGSDEIDVTGLSGELADEQKSNWLKLSGVIGCRLIGTENIYISSDTQTIVPFDNEMYDTDNMHDLTTNNDRITINHAGYYLVYANVRWGNVTSNTIYSALYYNGVTDIVRAGVDNGTNMLRHDSHVLVAIHYFDVGDYVNLQIYQNSGEEVIVYRDGESSTVLGAHLIGVA